MSKIKLLILLLVSFIFISCTENKIKKNEIKYSVGYISGEYDGLMLKNLLKSYLLSFDLYDEKSNFEIKPTISHSSNVYITNIDNTSDRTRIDSYLNIEIIDKVYKCTIYKFNKNISQFYILADSSKYISNNNAFEKLKAENTEILVKNFINNLGQKINQCSKTKLLRDKLREIRSE